MEVGAEAYGGKEKTGSSLTPDQAYILTMIADLGLSRAETARRLAVPSGAQSPPKVEPAPTRPSRESTA